MKIAFLAAGAAGMYCGSCMRDNAVARAMLRMGSDVVLVPLYTPLRVDGKDVSIDRVFYGGINVFLQQKLSLFRRTPRFLDRLFDSRALLNFSSKFAGMTKAEDLGELTLSTLRGEHGMQAKELDRLATWLGEELRPDVVNLPNSMFAGAARKIREATGATVVCSLSGEDLFLDSLPDAYRKPALDTLRDRCRQVDSFVAISAYYADFMADYLAVPPDRIDVVPLGLALDGFGRTGARPVDPFAVGYLARVAPEKGFHVLCDAFRILRTMPGAENARLRVAGWTGPRERPYLEANLARLADWGLADAVEAVGEVDFAGKLRFLDSVSVLSVPTVYRDPKGLFVLEALAHGVPVVMPNHGAFPELIASTGGGLLHEPENPEDLARQLHRVLVDREAADRMALRGGEAVRTRHTDTAMARATLDVYAKRAGARAPERRDAGR